MAPGNDRSVGQDCSECAICGLNAVHIPKLIFNCQAVTTQAWTAPGNNGSIGQNCGKCGTCGLNVARIPELTLNRGAVTT